MFDLSLSELGLITIVAVLVVDPKDLPAIARTCHKWWKEVRSVTDEIKAGVQDIIRDTGIEEARSDLENEMRPLADAGEEEPRYIRDQYGNFQRIYDVSEIVKERQAKAAASAGEPSAALPAPAKEEKAAKDEPPHE
jgi:Sec-independent protein translocase protein TatA